MSVRVVFSSEPPTLLTQMSIRPNRSIVWSARSSERSRMSPATISAFRPRAPSARPEEPGPRASNARPRRQRRPGAAACPCGPAEPRRPSARQLLLPGRAHGPTDGARYTRFRFCAVCRRKYRTKKPRNPMCAPAGVRPGVVGSDPVALTHGRAAVRSCRIASWSRAKFTILVDHVGSGPVLIFSGRRALSVQLRRASRGTVWRISRGRGSLRYGNAAICIAVGVWSLVMPATFSWT